MDIVPIIVFVLFTGILLKQVYYLKDIILSTRKSIAEIAATIVGVMALAAITYYYGTRWYHYLFFVIAAATFISLCCKHGISSKGFLSQYRGYEVLTWKKIKKVNLVKLDNKIKLIITGSFPSQNFYFKKNDLNKIVDVLKEHSIEINYGE